MLTSVETGNADFASARRVLSDALSSRRRVVVAANMNRDDVSVSNLTCWHCSHGDTGIDLLPVPVGTWSSPDANPEIWAHELVGIGETGDALIVTDAWGENEMLWWALRKAQLARFTTIAITPDEPNSLALLAHHAIRIPVRLPERREHVVTVLRHLVHTACASVHTAESNLYEDHRAFFFD